MDLVVSHHLLNCCMLWNVLGLFLGMDSVAVRGSIHICHLLLGCPIVCLWRCYAVHLVLVYVGFVRWENGGVDPCAPCV